MARQLQPFLWVVLLILATAAVALAQDTGSVSGVVRGADGAPLPGVTVTVSGPLLPVGRTTVTDSDGAFRFLRLPPGDYEVKAELEGMGNTRRAAVIALDKDTQVELELKPSVSEEITVTAALPTIDVKSSDVQANYSNEQIENLPVPRTFKGLFQLAPGVSENGRLAPNAGAARMDNTYLIDGMNVTNPHYGDILPDVTELDIAEVSIKRGGISAEYGRSAGMVVNAVTKSGTNELAGEVRLEYQPESFVSDSKISTLQNTRERRLMAASLGGPLVRDHFWFYASANVPTENLLDRRNNLGAVPDRELETHEYFGKLTANPMSSHFLSASVRSRDSTTKNSGIGSTTSPTAGTNDSTDYLLVNGSWVWNLTADSFTELKVNRLVEDNSGIPIVDLGYRPAFNAARPDLVGQFATTSDRILGGANAPGQTVGGASLLNFQDFERDDARLTFQKFAALGNTHHDLRAGATYEYSEERLDRVANGWGSITWSATTQRFTATYNSQQPPHTGRAETWGVFAQDQIALGERTTFTAGLLVNRDTYFGEVVGKNPGTKARRKILTFDWDQQLQPRLGLSFVPNAQRGDKIYASYGRYYNTENKSLTRAASPTRIFTTRATFDAAGHLLSEVPAANTQSKTIDAGLDPMYTDEYLAGYALPLGSTWSAEAWGMYRDVKNIFEDISADGLGGGPFHVGQLPNAYRKYTAATLQLNRRPVDDRFRRLWINASYTWSRLKGNWDIDYADSLFYNSSILQDGPGVLITDNRNGLLRGDRTNLVKLFATIEPIQRLRTGAYVRYQSGGAWEARAQPSANVSSSYFRYLEPAGSRRMEDWLNVDLLTSYEIRFGGIGIELEGRITNLFDKQVALAVDDRYLLNSPLNPSNPGPNPLLSPSNNPNFGLPTQLSDPRALVVSAIVRY
jgi:carboxypeptidase family protein/TonB-dependent receptor-like protein